MSVLAETESIEIVIPVPPMTVHRTVDRHADNIWMVMGWTSQFSSAFAAMNAIRDEVERDARHPVRVVIRWRGVPSGFVAPTTGTAI